MIGATLGMYLAKSFLRNMLFIFLLFFCLIVVVDLIELSRDLAKATDAGFFDILLIALFRAPGFAENILPFSALFAASATLLLLNRRLELVVARASGVSVWQFLLPLVLAAAFVGLLASLAYNPISLLGQIASKSVESAVFGETKGNFSNKSKNFWISLPQEEGNVILRARVAEDGGTKLTAVSAYRFAPDNTALERIDATTARFVESANGKNHYELSNASVTTPGEASSQKDSVILPVNISRAQLQADQTDASAISLWSLSQQKDRAVRAGKSTLPFSTRFQALLAQPLLFVAMVLVAATVSLRFVRFGQSGKVILGGILAGFVLYVLSKIVITFGSNGLVPPYLAAWSPAIVATLISATLLLHQEDG